MGDKRQSIVDMVEAELLEEQQRANERPTKPPQEAFARVTIGDAAAIAPVKKERRRRIIEQVAVRHDPRRDETDPPPPLSDPHASITKPPPPGYGPRETE